MADFDPTSSFRQQEYDETRQEEIDKRRRLGYYHADIVRIRIISVRLIFWLVSFGTVDNVD